jgi:hypothetical protein
MIDDIRWWIDWLVDAGASYPPNNLTSTNSQPTILQSCCGIWNAICHAPKWFSHRIYDRNLAPLLPAGGFSEYSLCKIIRYSPLVAAEWLEPDIIAMFDLCYLLLRSCSDTDAEREDRDTPGKTRKWGWMHNNLVARCMELWNTITQATLVVNHLNSTKQAPWDPQGVSGAYLCKILDHRQHGRFNVLLC